MFPKTDGSSEQSATGIPLLNRIGKGCIGMEEVSLCGTERIMRCALGIQEREIHQYLVP